MEDELKTTVKFTEHIFDGSGNKIMNSIQYTAMSIVPLLLVNNLLETQLPAFSQNTPPLSMIIETTVHIIVLLIVLYFVDRTVRYFPSTSGEKYGEVSFETIGLLLVLLIVNSSNSHLGKKVVHLTRHARERFTNREGMGHKESSGVDETKPKENNTDPTNTQPQKKPDQLHSMGDNSDHNERELSTKNPTATKKSENFTPNMSNSNVVEPMSSLESFAMTGGNYSAF